MTRTNTAVYTTIKRKDAFSQREVRAELVTLFKRFFIATAIASRSQKSVYTKESMVVY